MFSALGILVLILGFIVLFLTIMWIAKLRNPPPTTTEEEKPRYLRALDFIPKSKEKDDALARIALGL